MIRKEGNLGTKQGACIGMQFGKREECLIKDNITRNIDASSGNFKPLITFMKITIAKKDTLSGSKLKFMMIVGT